MLGANQTSMDGIIKTGKVLMEKSPEDDAIIIEGKIADLKARWDAICALSVERLVTSNTYYASLVVILFELYGALTLYSKTISSTFLLMLN